MVALLLMHQLCTGCDDVCLEPLSVILLMYYCNTCPTPLILTKWLREGQNVRQELC